MKSYQEMIFKAAEKQLANTRYFTDTLDLCASDKLAINARHHGYMQAIAETFGKSVEEVYKDLAAAVREF